MAASNNFDPVRCWHEQVVIPTYPVQDADPNPMFLEKRVYQGSSGRVYPNPFTDKVALEKKDQTYRAIMLENEYIQLMILPEIGGRIHAGLDKTNGYDFFYRQHVIKPALVGLLGPWISGGVEFNWPQHHRPSTYMPVHASIEEHADGSRTVWLSEHDPMLRMKGMVGICLAPGKAIIETKVRLYNRTPLPQTFLWWANVAVRVHDQYQAFFPPDVTFVADHAKRAISSFPIARNTYYGVDYRPGTDISWYKNIPVPTSYMVTESKYDFFGGYDYACQAGVVHTSNHRVAPGKKLWTWGNAEFGYAWDRNLTDNDGPYVELMAGAYTDNQPDFSWLQPFETKTFSQYWYPIQHIGPAKNANTQAAVNLEFGAATARVAVAVTSPSNVRIVLECNGSVMMDEEATVAPGRPFIKMIATDQAPPEQYTLIVRASGGEDLIAYQPEPRVQAAIPAPATEPPKPAQIATVEELYLTGFHLEQYRHATRLPDTYWIEGLKRDPENAQLNNAVGLLHLRKGEFVEAEDRFARAVRRLTYRNPNPYDGEPCYNLGLVRLYQGKMSDAYDAFYKSSWNYAWRSASNYALASISTSRGDLAVAMAEVEQSLLTNSENLKASALKASLFRRMGRNAEARALIEDSLARDRLDFRAMAERFLLSRREDDLRAWIAALNGDVQTLLDVTFDLAWEGLQDDAFLLLKGCSEAPTWNHPMVPYTLSWLAANLHEETLAGEYLVKAEAASPLYCFPARLEEMIVLSNAIERNPIGARAHYYLGNLYYDKRRYQEAIRCWQRSVELDDSYSIPWRNLGIAEFNVLHHQQAAEQMYSRAFAANPDDARLAYEWDQLKKRAGLRSPEERLHWLENHSELVACRDDLTLEFVTLLNQAGRFQEALSILEKRRFSPWEGGEGLAPAQYVYAKRALGVEDLLAAKPCQALEFFEAARNYPHNLGEGKHLLTPERDLNYLSGVAAHQAGNADMARKYWNTAAVSLPEPGMHSYFQALALRELGDEEAARETLFRLARFAEKKGEAVAEINYFATSLPNLLLFDDNLEERNRIESLFLAALADHGFGRREKAIDGLRQVTALDPNHQCARFVLDWIEHDTTLATTGAEVRPER